VDHVEAANFPFLGKFFHNVDARLLRPFCRRRWSYLRGRPNDPGPGDPTVSDPLEDGSAEHPFDAIQEGIDDAADGDTVLVLDGIYTGISNKSLDFNGKAITVRSENGPDNCVINCEGAGRGFYFHSAETAASVVDALTIVGGDADHGGGICCEFSSPTITDCPITSNGAYRGGGLYCESSTPTVANCTFSGNWVLTFGDCTHSYGGAMYNDSGSPTLINCTFSHNGVFVSSEDRYGYGGGMYNDSGSPTLIQCTFSENEAFAGVVGAYADGGAMYNASGSPTLTKCTFSGNRAGCDGGGMYNGPGSGPTLSDCAFSDNSADPNLFGCGGGMLNHNSNPTLTNCAFRGNSAGNNGGGMDNYNSSPTLSNCTFEDNSAGYGGGVHNGGNSSPTLVNSTFSENWAGSWGGGMLNELDVHAYPMLANCRFSNNVAGYGGAMCSWGGFPTLINCLFANNWAHCDGGGIANWDSSPTLANCTFSRNAAHGYPPYEGYGGGMDSDGQCSATLINCLLWHDTGAAGPELALRGYVGGYATATVSYSDLEGGQGAVFVQEGCALNWGPGNIDADPLFVDPDNDDFRLSACSPSIDAGDNTAVLPEITTDLDGNPRFVDDPGMPDDGAGDPPIVDMSAYEFQGETCFADLDGDNDVDLSDLAQLLANYGITGTVYTDGDLDRDEDVDLSDLAALLGVYGTTCP